MDGSLCYGGTLPTLDDFYRHGELDNSWEENTRYVLGNVDKDIAERSSCPKCHRLGMEYKEFTKDMRWRSFEVCPDCGHCEEF